MSRHTLTGLFSWEEEVRRSRFLAIADSVDDPAQAMAFIGRHSVPEATHNCWAYRIGDEYRFHDDGEPGGTAGRPILQAIDGQQCDHVAVLVVRWFGGTKLGTGGLVRAYGGCAAQCLRLAPKRELVALVRMLCHCPFSEMTLIQSRFRDYDVSVEHEEFDAEGVRWRLALPERSIGEFSDLVRNVTRGRGLCETVE